MAANYAPTLLPGKIAQKRGCAVNGWLVGSQVSSFFTGFFHIFGGDR